MILSTLAPRPQWEMPPLAPAERDALIEKLSQKFYYLHRGGQSAAFISTDETCVLKFYRFPSHMRPLSWTKHPISYRFSKKRAAIKAHNLDKLDITFRSFCLAYDELKEESGLLYLHINPTDTLHHTITLVDHLGNPYLLDLDSVTFVLQEKADPILPTIDSLLQAGDIAAAHAHLDILLDLITARQKKHIIDNDAILTQNYGFVKGRAIHIDIGRLEKKQTHLTPKQARDEATRLFAPLINHLEKKAPKLATYFHAKVEATYSSRS